MAINQISAADSRIQWMGRVHLTDDGVRFGYPGVACTLCFQGECMDASFIASSAGCYFDCSVDDAPPTILRLTQGESTVALAERLNPAQPHRIVLVWRAGAWQGTVRMKSVLLPEGADLRMPPPLPERQLLFVGDSITAGEGVDRLPPDYPAGAVSSNANGTYGWELARRLNAQVHLVACGGRGVIRDWQGLGDNVCDTAPTFFERTVVDEPDVLWDHSRYTPDVVVIGLGSNDFNQGIPEQTVWVNAYATFLERIRAVHPDAWIFVLNSPIFSARRENGDFAKAAVIEHYLRSIIAHRRAAGEDRLEMVLLRYQPGTEKDAHPIRPQHILMADDLEPVLRDRLNW